jgi:hypothetical protein
MDGTFTYRSSKSQQALSNIEDGVPSRFSSSKYQFGCHIVESGQQYLSFSGHHSGRCPFFKVVKGDGRHGSGSIGCEGCRKKTLEERKTREREAERKDKAFREKELVWIE